jgi:hypothetical protein
MLIRDINFLHSQNNGAFAPLLCVSRVALSGNRNFLLGNDRNQIDNPEDAEEVTGDKLQYADHDTGGIAAGDAVQSTVNIVYDDQQELNDPIQTLKSLSEISHDKFSFLSI